MKSERRHELQHNDLAEWITAGYERIVPYRNALLGAGLLAIVLIIGLSLWHSHSVAQAGEAWNSLGIPVYQPNFMDGNTVGAMQHSAQTYPGVPAGQWADVLSGDSALMIGTNKILTDKKIGLEYLGQARDIYNKALDSNSLTIPGAREQAMFGKARAIEALIQNKGQVDEAIAAYQDVVTKFPKGAFQAICDQRIEQLKKPDTLKFYETFAQYTPKSASPQSQPGNVGSVPDNPTDEAPPVPTPPVRPDGSQPGPNLGLPEPSATPLGPMTPTQPKSSGLIPESSMVPPASESPKGSAVKLQDVAPDAPSAEAPKTSAAKAEAPKAEAPKKGN